MPDSRFYPVPRTVSLKDITDFLGVEESSHSCKIKGVNDLENAGTAEIAACFDKKSLPLLRASQAGACLVTEEMVSHVPSHIIPLVVKNPRAAFAKIGHLFYPAASQLNLQDERGKAHIHPSVSIGLNVVVGKGAEIGENTIIGPGAYIGEGVKIGKNCRIYDNVTVLKAIIGDNVSIHSGARIGSEGFGFVQDGSDLIDIPHLGRVLIKNNVRIGANTTIDRGVLGDTVIGEFCRIDNLAQIAHNVHLGRGCVIVSQVGIAGSTHIGDFSILAGQVGIAGHLKIGNHVTIAAQSGVMKDISDGEKVGGSPAVPLREWHRQVLYLSKVIKK